MHAILGSFRIYSFVTDSSVYVYAHRNKMYFTFVTKAEIAKTTPNYT